MGELTLSREDKHSISILTGYIFALAIFIAFQTLPAFAEEQYSVELLNENDGFTTSIVFSMAQDQQGFLWLGTAYNGLMRFDGENVVNFKKESAGRYQLKYNENGNLFIDDSGLIWIGSWGGGVAVLDPVTNEKRYFERKNDDKSTISDSRIHSIFADDRGVMWFGSRSGGLNRFDRTSETFQRFGYRHTFDYSAATQSDIEFFGPDTSHQRIWAINQVKSGELWVGTGFGLNRLNLETKQFEYFFPDISLGLHGINTIRRITPVSENKLLLGTQDGTLIFDIENQEFQSLKVEQDVALGPIYSMLETDFGEYWVATSHGVYAYSDDIPIMRKVPLGFDDSCALSLFQDDQGIIWLSCEGRGIYKIVPQLFFKTLNHPIAKTARSLHMAHDGDLLIGTQSNGIYKWNWRTKSLMPLSESNLQFTHSIRKLMQDHAGNIWFSDSLFLYQMTVDGKTTKITPPLGTPNANRLTNIGHMMQDNKRRIWVGTSSGLFVISDINEPFAYYGADSLAEGSLSNNRIMAIYQDRQQRIWVGTSSSVELWQPETNTFRQFGDGLVHAIHQDVEGRIWLGRNDGFFLLDEETGELQSKGNDDITGHLGIRYIIGDDKGSLWLITRLGVIKYNPATDELREFDKKDGLSGARYFTNLAVEANDGTIFISSREGIHYFSPKLIKDHPVMRKTVLTDFEILGGKTDTGLQIAPHNTLSLAPNENYLRFDFATIDLLNAKQIHYSYMLEGLDEEWIDNGTSNSVVYSNLSGGDYRFRVKAMDKNNLRYTSELIADVHIATPVWLQTWMITLYAFLSLAAIAAYIKHRQNRDLQEIQRQKRFVAELEIQVAKKTREIRNESQKLAKANQVKSQFLANMSHEIRTPLTAIIGLSESIIEGDVQEQEAKPEVARIHNQSQHLLALLNDILDVTKIEENKLELRPYALNVATLMEEINDIFATQAEAKGLAFGILSQLPSNLTVYIDGLRLKQVLINLISNALKFTNEGQVDVIVSQQDSDLLFSVVDTGIGMSEKQAKRIFEVFTQADNTISRRFGGSGLGLAVSQKLAVLMKGELQVSSHLNKGSVFTFRLPIEVRESTTSDGKQTTSNECLPQLSGNILLAEDHPDNRRFITRLLERIGFSVATASNGEKAITLFKQLPPDLVLLDIQMPVMDGIQTFKALREMGAKQPIVAITANVLAHDIERYKNIGFDDCLTKPIVRKHLVEIISRYFTSNLDVGTLEQKLKHTDMDDLRIQFIARLPSELIALEQVKGEINKVNEIVHKLNGAASLLGFKELAKYAAEVEIAANKEPAKLAECLAALLIQLRQLSEKL